MMKYVEYFNIKESEQLFCIFAFLSLAKVFQTISSALNRRVIISRVSGRLEMLQDFMTSLEPFLRLMIRYIKCVPGFLTLPPEDQVSILKGTYSSPYHQRTRSPY